MIAMGAFSLAIATVAGLGVMHVLALEVNGSGMWTVIVIIYAACLWGLVRVVRPYQLILRLLRR